MSRRLELVLLLLGLTTALLGACSRSPADPSLPRVLVRGATLRVLVESFDGLEAALAQRISALGGFTTTSELTGSGSDAALTVVFRVPSAKLELALAAVESLTKQVESRQVRGEDFTEEYVDLEAQRVNLAATRDRLLALLGKATKVDDALEVNQGLTEVQGQLEKLVGRMKYLEQGAALSTVTVTFSPESHAAAWRPLEVARAALRSLLSVLQFLGSAAIVLVIFSPLWGPPLWLLRRRRAAR